MPFLLLYIGEDRKFDPQLVANGLNSLKGAEAQASSPNYLLMYEFAKGADLTTIGLKTDRKAIVIDGSGEASLAAALYIQASYPEDIRLIDEGYSFDLVLRDIGSVSELEQKIKDAGG